MNLEVRTGARTADRLVLSGTWLAEGLNGRYLFSVGLADTYLELRLGPRATSRLPDVLPAMSGRTAVRSIGAGTGLAVLETFSLTETRLAPAARLAALVSSLQVYLPGLTLCSNKTRSNSRDSSRAGQSGLAISDSK